MVKKKSEVTCMTERERNKIQEEKKMMMKQV